MEKNAVTLIKSFQVISHIRWSKLANIFSTISVPIVRASGVAVEAGHLYVYLLQAHIWIWLWSNNGSVGSVTSLICLASGLVVFCIASGSSSLDTKSNWEWNRHPCYSFWGDSLSWWPPLSFNPCIMLPCQGWRCGWNRCCAQFQICAPPQWTFLACRDGNISYVPCIWPRFC